MSLAFFMVAVIAMAPPPQSTLPEDLPPVRVAMSPRPMAPPQSTLPEEDPPPPPPADEINLASTFTVPSKSTAYASPQSAAPAQTTLPADTTFQANYAAPTYYYPPAPRYYGAASPTYYSAAPSYYYAAPSYRSRGFATYYGTTCDPVTGECSTTTFEAPVRRGLLGRLFGR
jgi:predicted PhzF superfamily epimerase YddE/YHI9